MIPEWYHQLFTQHQTLLTSRPNLYVALSAGIDSNVMLHWLYTFKHQLPPITAIHVNHQLHGEYSFIWADFAKKSAQNYGFKFINYEITLDPNDPKGTEAAGREARYIKFAETMKENSLLLVAHHRSDQAETVFHRLTRGAGLRGLGGMRTLAAITFGHHCVNIFRPFLNISKKELYQTGQSLNLPWMEDYTNHEESYTRNQIRNGIFPKVNQFFPHYEDSFASSASFLQEAQDLVEEIAEEDLQIVSHLPAQISRIQLLTLSELRQKNVLRYWLSSFNYTLSHEQFKEFYRIFIQNIPTHQSEIITQQFILRYFRNTIYLLTLPQNEMTPIIQWQKSAHAPTMDFWSKYALKIADRIEGIYFHPMNRNKRQTLKKLLQEADIPTWERKTLKMIVDQHSNEILFIDKLGLSQTLEPFCQQDGVIPEICFR